MKDTFFYNSTQQLFLYCKTSIKKMSWPGATKQAYHQHSVWDHARAVQWVVECHRVLQRSGHPETGALSAGVCWRCTPRQCGWIGWVYPGDGAGFYRGSPCCHRGQYFGWHPSLKEYIFYTPIWFGEFN